MQGERTMASTRTWRKKNIDVADLGALLQLQQQRSSKYYKMESILISIEGKRESKAQASRSMLARHTSRKEQGPGGEEPGASIRVQRGVDGLAGILS